MTRRAAKSPCRTCPSPALRRAARVRAARSSPARLSPRRPNVEIVEAARPALDQHRAPRAGRPRVARGALRLPPARLRGRLLAQPAPEGRRVRRLPLRRAALPALRQERRAAERGRARHVRRAGLRHHAAQRADPAARVPVRALPLARGRRATSSSARAPATCSTRSSTTASTRRSRCCARWATSSSASRRTSSRAAPREIVRDISNVKQEIINFRKIVRPQRAALQRPRAHQALHPRGPRHLLRRHQRRVRAHLGHARELQGGRRGARVDERVGPLATGSTTSCGCSPRSASIVLPLTLIASVFGHEHRACPASSRSSGSGSSSA